MSLDKKRRRQLQNQLILAYRQQQRLWLSLLAASLTALAVWSYSKSGSLEETKGKKAVRYDRERDDSKFGFPQLEELIDRDRLWPPDLDKPLCTPKIYIYDLPPHLLLTPAQVAQCRWSAYNSELLLYSLLTKPSPGFVSHVDNSSISSLVTSDPSEANLFFIPLFPSCYLFNCWVKAGWKRTERCGVDEEYIMPIMDFIKSQGWWEKSGGNDHIITHPMDFIDGYYKEETRAAMNSSIYLVTVGDLRPSPYSQHYRHYQDLLIPSSTHLLNSYYINPMDYLSNSGHPLPTPRGAADPSRKSTVVPTQVEIFEPSSGQGSLWGRRPNWFSYSKVKEKLTKRSTLAIFRGGLGEPGEGEAYALGIRSLFFPTPDQSLPHSHKGFSSLPGFDIAISSENEEYALALSRSKFGLAPPGYTLDTTRFYEYLAFGVVPVFIGTGHRAGQVLPFQTDFDYDSFTISIPRSKAHLVPEILANYPEEEYERLRKNVWEVGRLLVLEEGRGNAWKWIVRGLCRMRGIGMGVPSGTKRSLMEEP